VTGPPPAVLVFDFSDALPVLWASIDGVPAAFTQADDLLRLRFPAPPAPGDTLEASIAYRGRPEPGFLVGLRFSHHEGVSVVYTNCEPIAARTWWPCKDRPDDKFTADLRFIVPDTLIAASNGTLRETLELPGARRLFHWEERYPIATYLVSLVATDFATFSDTYVAADGREMPLTYYAFPEDLPRAMQDWAFTPRAIAALAGIFGEYPFLDEKYGMAQFPWAGAMEHQTLTSMGTYFLRLPEPADWVVVHELAHQWWGDLVTCGTWRDIWLNEGFATYAEALWAEHLAGPDSLRAVMQSKKSDHFHGACYDPDFIFNATVYRKGAWALHMLRRVVGNETFFAALRRYAADHAYGAAVTEDLKRAFESQWGHDLDWFFAEWIYGEGQPRYRVRWEPVAAEAPAGARARIEIVQESTGPDLFKMPLDALFLLRGGGEFRTVLWDSLAEQVFTVEVPAMPESLAIDPDGWVLGEVLYVAEPGATGEPSASHRAGLALGAAAPNPSSASFRIPLRCEAPPTSGAWLSICDAAGRLVRRLGPSPAAGGGWAFVWDGRDARGREAPAGIYLGRLETAAPAARVDRVRILRMR
jgi:aminopeptidase N